MPLIDDRGRVLGKINLIDLALLVFAVVLIPVGYGAYVLFRTPPPVLIGITPNPAIYARGELRVRLRGEHLRPFLRAQLGKADAKAFLIESPQAAEMVFNETPPGTYDLTVFDASEQVGHLANALTVVPPAGPPIQLVGRFVGPGAGAATVVLGGALTVGNRQAAQIVDLGPAANAERPAVLRVTCDSMFGTCTIGGAAVEKGKRIAFRAAGRDAAVDFAIDELRVDGVWADVQVTMFGIPEVLNLMRVGDSDRFREAEESRGGMAHGAVLHALEAVSPAPGELRLSFQQGLPDGPALAGNVTSSVGVAIKARMAVVTVPLVGIDGRWKYRDEIIRPGSALAFETPDYFVRGLITRVTLPKSTNREQAGH